MTATTPVERFTEASLLDLLCARYATVGGNGPRYVFMPHVRSAPGFDARRTLDAVVMDLWRSAGNALHGFEVKVSRSDWLRELADPSKAGQFLPLLDRFWIVAPRGVVLLEELPVGWGLLVPVGDQLRAVRSPVDLVSGNRLLPVGFVACLLRAARYEAVREVQA